MPWTPVGAGRMNSQESKSYHQARPHILSQIRCGGVCVSQSTAGRAAFRKDTAYFLFMLAVSVASSALGCWIAGIVFEGVSLFRIHTLDLYGTCHLPIEYLGRCAVLCRPFLIDAAVLLLAACSRFEYLLSSVYFLLRGIAFGTALYVVLHTGSTSAVLYLPIVYVSVTLMYLIYSRMLRTKNGPCPRTDALVYALITAGAASIVFTAVTASIS